MARITKDDLKIGVSFTPCKKCERVWAEWVSTLDGLPIDEKPVLAYYGFERSDGDLGMMFMGTLCYFCFDKEPHWQHASNGLVVTHWMPLPEPPKGGEG